MSYTAETAEGRAAIRAAVANGTWRNPPTGSHHVMMLAALLDITVGDLMALIRPTRYEQEHHAQMMAHFALDVGVAFGGQLAAKGLLRPEWAGWLDGEPFPFDPAPNTELRERGVAEPMRDGTRPLYRRCKECGQINLMTTVPQLGICDDCA